MRCVSILLCLRAKDGTARTLKQDEHEVALLQRFMVTASISGGAMQTHSTTFSPYLDIRH